MARIRIEQLGEGQHPSEIVVAVRTADGSLEKLIVDRRSIRDNSLEVGYPVGENGANLLVELPRESVRGVWRVWVPREAILGQIPA
jgi:hypothetical protein